MENVSPSSLFVPCVGQERAAGYTKEMLIVFILAPIIAALMFLAVIMLIVRKLQQRHMERLNSRDAEYGTIEGLIASNVGDSTLAVSYLVS